MNFFRKGDIMKIIRYQEARDYEKLLELLIREGDDWQCYHAENIRDTYKKLLKKSITFVLYFHETIIGYLRCLYDVGFYVYICDLLVDKNYRGHGYGRMLMDRVKNTYKDQTVFVMSDVDPYYTKLGYEREGSIFIVS